MSLKVDLDIMTITEALKTIEYHVNHSFNEPIELIFSEKVHIKKVTQIHNDIRNYDFNYVGEYVNDKREKVREYY
jgi:hypothetical protein